MRNCENVYVGDITIENPSNHSVNILDSRNIATTNVKVFYLTVTMVMVLDMDVHRT